jgi:hypothetical protein
MIWKAIFPSMRFCTIVFDLVSLLHEIEGRGILIRTY